MTAAETWKKGRINGITTGRILYHLATHLETGLLQVVNNTLWMKARITDGALCDVQSNFIQGDTLGTYLTRQNIITTAEHKKSFQRAQKTGIPQGQVLVDMQIITDRELIECLTRHMTIKFLRLFSGLWENGTYEFAWESFFLEGFTMSPVPLAGLLRQGYLEAAICKDLLHVYKINHLQATPIALTDSYEQTAGLLELDVTHREMAGLIDGKNLDELKRLHPEQFDDLLRLASLLIAANAAAFEVSVMELPQEQEEVEAKEEPTPPSAPVPPSQPERPSPVQRPLPEPKFDDSVHRAAAASRAELRPQNALPESFPGEEPNLLQLLLDAQHSFYQDDFKTAMVWIQQALKAEPDHPRALAMYAWAQYQAGGKTNPEVAALCKQILQRAIDLEQDNDIAMLFLGRILKGENLLEQARTLFEKACEANPFNEEAKQELAGLGTGSQVSL